MEGTSICSSDLSISSSSATATTSTTTIEDNNPCSDKRVNWRRGNSSVAADSIGSLAGTPFSFVSGNVSHNRFNPFRKKSGLLSVLSRTLDNRRIVRKGGQYNTCSPSYTKSNYRLLKDFFASSLSLSWRWIMAASVAVSFLSWSLFAVGWYLIALQHGDLEEVNQKNASFTPCVTAIKGYASCFLFSMETQQTVGYGLKATTDQCPFAFILMGLQSITGFVIQAFVAGVIFAKFTVPKNRGETILFSRNALISMVNGALCLTVQVADLRKYCLIAAKVRMILVGRKETEEGLVVPYYRTELKCSTTMEIDEEPNDNLFMLWPTVILHKIDHASPLYKMDPVDFLKAKFEIIVLVEGVTQETGNTIQARSSYRPNEVLWGQHFDCDPLVYSDEDNMYEVRHSLINRSIPDHTPRISAFELGT